MFMILGCLALSAMMGATSEPPFPRIANCYASRLTSESTAKDIDEISRIDLLIGGLWCNWNDLEHVKKLHERIAEVRKKNPDISHKGCASRRTDH